jgi:hypothetical protein
MFKFQNCEYRKFILTAAPIKNYPAKLLEIKTGTILAYKNVPSN